MLSAKVILVFIAALILTGCSLLPFAKEEKTVTLNYWGLWESPATINQLIADFKKENPKIDVIYEKKSPQQYRESLISQINAGRGPDIFRFHNTWTQVLYDILTPVPSDVVSQSEFKKNFYPTVFNDLRNSKKEFVGVPLEIDGLALFYNEDIFNAAGIVRPPTTWQEFAQDAVKLTVKDPVGNITTAGAALGTASNTDHFSDILGLMILQNGGDPKSPTDKASADALTYYTNFARGEPRIWDETLPASTIAFAGGNLAMYFAPSWRAIEIKNSNPLLNFKVAPVPQLENGSINWASYWANGVSAKSAHVNQAWEFVKYLNEEQTLIKLYSEAAKSPGRLFGQPYPTKALGQQLMPDPIVGAYIGEAPTMQSFPMASLTWDNGVNDQIIKAYEDAINTVAQGGNAASALQTTANIIT